MSWWLTALVVVLAVYALAVVGLVLAGRHTAAAAVARFVPDCMVLFRRLLGDARVPRRVKVAIALLVAYLASPLDLVPDVIPVAGQLDDVILVVLVLRAVIRAAGPAILAEHWPGSEPSLAGLLRFAGKPRVANRV